MATLKVFYSDQQSVASNHSFSPSAGKPQRVVAQWRARYPVEIVVPEPATETELCLAHDRDYVHEVLAGRHANGFGNTSLEVARSLPWTTGSFLSAARHVAHHGGIACSPTSGFHHARYAEGGGFCTFNGLMVAALALPAEVGRIGILDCDFHYGDGTDDIIRRLGVDRVAHYTTGGFSGPRSAWRFLNELDEILDELSAQVLFYQAGADAHVDDPLGGWMTTEEMRERDRKVFRYCRRHGIPVVWNLAGGYQAAFQNVLDLHHATMEEALAAFSSDHTEASSLT